jgi:CRP-like cAMP-binding protein
MEYTTVPKDHFVFEYGDVGEHFFVILDGRVEVQIPLSKKRREHDMVRL